MTTNAKEFREQQRQEKITAFIFLTCRPCEKELWMKVFMPGDISRMARDLLTREALSRLDQGDPKVR